LLLGLNLLILFPLEISKTVFLGLLALSLDTLDTFTLLIVVFLLECFLELGLLLSLVFSQEETSLLGVFIFNMLLSSLRFFFDLLGMLLLEKFATAL